MEKLIFRFNNQSSQSFFKNKDLLGGKGANLAQMANLGLPVPPGFTISTKACEYFNNNKIPKKLIKLVSKELKIIEKFSKKKFKLFVDCKKNYGLFINLVLQKIDFLQVKADLKTLSRLKNIAKKNKVTVNPKISIINLANIKNIKSKIQKIYK